MGAFEHDGTGKLRSVARAWRDIAHRAYARKGMKKEVSVSSDMRILRVVYSTF